MYTPRGKRFEPVTSDEKNIAAVPRYVIDNVNMGQYWPEGDMAFHRRITIPTLLLHGMKDDKVSFVEMCEMEKVINHCNSFDHLKKTSLISRLYLEHFSN